MTTIHYLTSGTVLTSVASVAAAQDAWKITAFLSAGASLGVLWSILSMEGVEGGRKTAARVIIGALGGTGVPLLLDAGVERWCKFKVVDQLHPFGVMLVGFAFAVLGFYVLHTYFRGAELKQKAMSKALGNSLSNVASSIVKDTLGAKLPDTKDERKSNSEDSPDRG